MDGIQVSEQIIDVKVEKQGSNMIADEEKFIDDESENDDQEYDLKLEQSIFEMNRLLEIQPRSKAIKFCKIIRESNELSTEELLS